MTVSIVTICYNNIQGLQKTRISIASQTYRDFEWIVIDGGSVDGTKDFLQEHSDEMSYWCSEKDNGVYNAQNKGISFAKGDYVICMNSGDVFHDSEVLSNVFAKKQMSDVLYGNWHRVYQDGHVEEKKSPEIISPYFFYYDNICHQAMFVRTKLLQDSPFDESYAVIADWAKWRELNNKGCTFCNVPIVVCDYEAGTGLSETMNEKSIKDHNRLKESIPSYVQQDIEGLTKPLKVYISELEELVQKNNEIIEKYKTDNAEKFHQLEMQNEKIKNLVKQYQELFDSNNTLEKEIEKILPIYENKYVKKTYSIVSSNNKIAFLFLKFVHLLFYHPKQK